MIFKCMICGKVIYHNRFKTHLNLVHNMNDKDYYDEYILKNNKDKICYCGKEKKFNNCVQGYGKTCGDSACAKLAYKQTCLEKYGFDNPAKSGMCKKKNRETCIKKYGVSHANKRKEFKDKIKIAYDKKHEDPELKEIKEANKRREETCNEIYGVPNVFKSEVIKAKITSAMIVNHGVDNISKSKMAKEKKLKKVIKRTGSKNPFTKEERNKGNVTKAQKSFKTYLDSDFFIEKVIPLFSLEEYKGGKFKYKWKCVKCDHRFKTQFKGVIPLCPKCFPYGKGSSKWEREVFDFVSSQIKTKHNVRFYYSGKRFYELDIFIPSLNIGFECDGVKRHSERFGRKDKGYHLRKTKFFENKGIKVYHFYDIEWYLKNDLIKSIILSKLNLIKNKVFARKCEVKEISSYESDVFLNTNHLQGKCVASVRLGLFYNNTLVALMTFGKSRFNKNYEWELLRYCSSINTSIVGGFNKLLSHFIKNNKGSIISYADRRISFGEVYLKNNFKFIQESSPSYYYFNNKYVLENRIKFQKHKLKDILSVYKPELSEWENMQLNDYDRIWDCGTLSFTIS